jgi:Flp pilus assembly protein TadB
MVKQIVNVLARLSFVAEVAEGSMVPDLEQEEPGSSSSSSRKLVVVVVAAAVAVVVPTAALAAVVAAATVAVVVVVVAGLVRLRFSDNLMYFEWIWQSSLNHLCVGCSAPSA